MRILVKRAVRRFAVFVLLLIGPIVAVQVAAVENPPSAGFYMEARDPASARVAEYLLNNGFVAVEEKGAIAELMAFRKQEGEALAVKLSGNISNIAALLQSVEPYEMERVTKIRERITAALEKTISVDYDKNRLEQELIYYIEKLDVNEEKQRLTNHLKYFAETMGGDKGQGKKLGFIAQEMGREINTLGSKSNHAEMQNIVVKMKDELEQIKEQVLNIM